MKLFSAQAGNKGAILEDPLQTQYFKMTSLTILCSLLAQVPPHLLPCKLTPVSPQPLQSLSLATLFLLIIEPQCDPQGPCVSLTICSSPCSTLNPDHPAWLGDGLA